MTTSARPRPSGNDVACLARRHDLETHRDRGWLTLVARGGALPREDLGRPGLWRTLATGERVFEIPPVLVPTDDAEAADALVGWAASTADRSARDSGAGPPAPTPEELASWSRGARLDVQVGVHTAVIQVVHDPGRLALVCPFATIPEGLGAGRAAWLDATLGACERWRLVRLGASADPDVPGAPGDVLAEVDLTGMPLATAPTLFHIGLAALRRVVSWALPSVATILDTSHTPHLLDAPPPWIPSPDERGRGVTARHSDVPHPVLRKETTAS